MTVKVKICGITRIEDAALAVELGAEMIGLNFYPPSPRCLSLERARALASAVAGRARLVGVFVNAERSYIQERLETVGLDMVQFHGDESDDELAGWPVPIVRACRVAAGSSLDFVDRIKGDYVLLDTFDPELFGGTGRFRPLEELRGRNLSRVIISGGLTATSAAMAAALGPYALDVASGVESEPGVKDHAKLRSFIVNAKSA